MKPAVSVHKMRHALKSAMREFFRSHHHLEIDTPVLVTCPGTEVFLDYFDSTWVDHSLHEQQLYLRSSPELHMKQALASLQESVFQFAPCFRNSGEYSAWHHPEFTMLEWYTMSIEYDAFISLTLELLRFTARAFAEAFPGIGTFSVPDTVPRISVAEAFARYAGIELCDEDPSLGKKAAEKGLLSPRSSDDFATAFHKVFIEAIEPKLAASPLTVLYDYPASMAALAETQEEVAKRFEIYAGRVELCNAFLELRGTAANTNRINSINQARQEGGRAPIDAGRDYLDACDNLPQCCGNALGFDRWLAILAGQESIDHVVPSRMDYQPKQT